MYNKTLEEKNFALKDQLTGLYNRREYENTLETYNSKDIEKDLVFLSMDVNSLKMVNDQYGHAAGDRMLKGAADCIEACFGEYGKIFRYGGDEFVAIVFLTDDELRKNCRKFSQTTEEWTAKNQILLKVSLGYAKASEYPHADIYKLSSIADREMYREKASYYKLYKNRRRED